MDRPEEEEFFNILFNHIIDKLQMNIVKRLEVDQDQAQSLVGVTQII
jgi:hypothetical protein